MRCICAWCERVLREGEEGAPTTHGICLECYPVATGAEVVSLPTLSREDFDALPYGAIRLDSENKIIAYNAAESELARRAPAEVMGKDFFKQVAPCTNVAELAGWLQLARKSGETRQTRLDFVFDFPFGREHVDIAILYDAPHAVAHVLVRVEARQTADA